MATILLDSAGPLPISETFASNVDGPATLVVAGSVWSKTLDVLIGVKVLLDGTEIGVADIFSNGATTHRAVVPQYMNVNLTIGDHTLTLEASTSQTVSDINDRYRVVLTP